jgi:adenosine deaminase
VARAAACRRYDVIGIGLGGDERAHPTAAFAPAFREARRLGLRTTVHAGEFDGPRSVWEAIDVLEVERIGHGVRAVEDAELVRVLVRRGIPLECCPTSNVKTGVVRGWEEHPVRTLAGAGAAVTINSDDPALFGTTLLGEWEALVGRLGFTPAEAVAAGIRTARATFQPAPEREALAAAMTRAAARAGIAV